MPKWDHSHYNRSIPKNPREAKPNIAENKLKKKGGEFRKIDRENWSLFSDIALSFLKTKLWSVRLSKSIADKICCLQSAKQWKTKDEEVI